MPCSQPPHYRRCKNDTVPPLIKIYRALTQPTSKSNMTRERIEDFSPPWAQAIINDPEWKQVSTWGREVMPPPSTENAMMAITLNRPDSARAVLTFYRKTSPLSSPSSSPTPVSFKGFEIRMLWSLGSGLDGHSGF